MPYDSIDQFLDLFPAKRVKIKNGWNVICPAHPDKNPSLSVSLNADKILVNCKAGCDVEQIVKSLNITMADLFIGTKLLAPPTPKEVCRYNYDKDGKLIHQTVRYSPKSFKQCRPDTDGKIIWNLDGIEPILYNYGDITSAIIYGDTIFIPEGEKDCDNLTKWGLHATTNAMGIGGKWRDNYTETLKDAKVVILADNDKGNHINKGIEFAYQKAKILKEVCKSVKVIIFPDDKDVSDWLERGHTIDELNTLIVNTPEWTPLPDRFIGKTYDNLICLANVEPKAIDWLWYPYIPKGMVSMLDGDPGGGKSFITLAITTSITLGKALPHDSTKTLGNVLIASAEDGIANTIVPRLLRMGADMTKVFCIPKLFTLDDDGVNMLDYYLFMWKPALLVIDPLSSYIAGSVDIHRSNQVRGITSKLYDLADKHNVAIIALRHMNKSSAMKAIYRGMGGIDFTGQARSELLAGSDADDPSIKGIIHIKANNAPLGEPIGYTLVTDQKDRNVCDFMWLDQCQTTESGILGVSGGGGDKLQQAKELLTELLSEDEVDQKSLSTAADTQGISLRTLNTAKKALGIVSSKQGNKWYWKMPQKINDKETENGVSS